MNEPTDDKLLDTFANLTDTLVTGYDVVDLLHTLVESCQNLLDIDASGILLADDQGLLDVVASSSEANELVEMMAAGAISGPASDCYRSGTIVTATISPSHTEWEEFVRLASRLGFTSTFAIPLRLRTLTIGVLSLFRVESEPLDSKTLRAAKALADVATIGVLHERSVRESAAIQAQLTGALQSRIVVEQAKGVISHTHGISMDEAFQLLRSYARSNRLMLSSVADGVVRREIQI
jgi:transcriptional regulator with GAF, ATPase, and Fis domain